MIALQAFGDHMFQNERVLVAAKNQLFNSIKDSALLSAQTALSNMQGDSIRENIEALKKRKDEELGKGGFDPDLLVNECVVNPQLPACRPKVPPLGYVGGGFKFEGPGNSGTLTSPSDDDYPFAPYDELDIGGAGPLANIPESLKNELDTSIPTPSGSRLGFGGPGGGGGGGPSGGAPGGGGQGGVTSKDFEKRGGGRSSRIRDVKAMGNIGPGGRLFGGGRLQQKKSGDLASLFKKNTKDKIKNAIINYRMPVSVTDKNSNIFQRISFRYDQVEGDKRLLEYEVK